MFSWLKNAKKEVERHAADQTVRKIVMYQSQGSVSLQRGLYVTADDIERKRKDVFAKA